MCYSQQFATWFSGDQPIAPDESGRGGLQGGAHVRRSWTSTADNHVAARLIAHRHDKFSLLRTEQR